VKPDGTEERRCCRVCCRGRGLEEDACGRACLLGRGGCAMEQTGKAHAGHLAVKVADLRSNSYTSDADRTATGANRNWRRRRARASRRRHGVEHDVYGASGVGDGDEDASGRRGKIRRSANSATGGRTGQRGRAWRARSLSSEVEVEPNEDAAGDAHGQNGGAERRGPWRLSVKSWASESLQARKVTCTSGGELGGTRRGDLMQNRRPCYTAG
jgi:hypothetical protein